MVVDEAIINGGGVGAKGVYSIPASGSRQVMALEKESTSSIGVYGFCLDIDDVEWGSSVGGRSALGQ